MSPSSGHRWSDGATETRFTLNQRQRRQGKKAVCISSRLDVYTLNWNFRWFEQWNDLCNLLSCNYMHGRSREQEGVFFQLGFLLSWHHSRPVNHFWAALKQQSADHFLYSHWALFEIQWLRCVAYCMPGMPSSNAPRITHALFHRTSVCHYSPLLSLCAHDTP